MFSHTKPVLAGALLLSLSLPLSVGAFSDIQNPKTAQEVEILQMMNIVSGVSPERYAPDETLTRAQFTKMAVSILGKTQETYRFSDYTIFPDVGSTHWAKGYINFAVRSEKKFISGFSDGTFAPDRPIGYGEAVTILMRLLGYTDADVGVVWPDGYLLAAKSTGLTETLALGGEDKLTRSQAATLFCNLLRTFGKEGSSTFGESIASSVQKNAILIQANAKNEDGSPALETTLGTFTLAHDYIPQGLQGLRGTVLLNVRGEAWGFLPNALGSSKQITIASANSTGITDQNGILHKISADVKVYEKGEESNYGDAFVKLRNGTKVTLHIGTAGKIEYIFIGGETVDTALVIDANGSDKNLSALAEYRTDYRIYRHKELVTAAALRRFDVATYDPSQNEIRISTEKLTGRYESAYPNAEAPAKVTVFGQEFAVLPRAVASLRDFQLGDRLTLLLTEDGQVAGAISPKDWVEKPVGIATLKGKTATIALANGMQLTGDVEGEVYQTYDGLLVEVDMAKNGSLLLKPVQESYGKTSVQVQNKMLGTVSIAEDAQLYERIGAGTVFPLAWEDIRLQEVPRTQVLHSKTNDQGKVSLLLLDNVTGNHFQYGIVYTGSKAMESNPERDVLTMGIKTPTGKVDALPLSPKLSLPSSMRLGFFGGIALNRQGNMVTAYTKLETVTGVQNKHFEDEDTILYQGETYAVAKDVLCYRPSSESWLTLAQARAFDVPLTLHVDAFGVVRILEITK